MSASLTWKVGNMRLPALVTIISVPSWSNSSQSDLDSMVTRTAASLGWRGLSGDWCGWSKGCGGGLAGSGSGFVGSLLLVGYMVCGEELEEDLVADDVLFEDITIF